MEPKLPLRARKKAKVREALIQTSFRLFSERGYTETTLEQICEECDVTVQTLLRYFGSKDDLLFAKHPAIIERFHSGLVLATQRKASLEYWIKFLHSNARRVRDEREVRDSYKIIVGAPSLLARFYAIGRQYAALLEQALLEENGLQADQDMHSTLLANAIVMGPLEEALRALSQNKAAEVVERTDTAAKYVMENFKRPERRDEIRTSGQKEKGPPAQLRGAHDSVDRLGRAST